MFGVMRINGKLGFRTLPLAEVQAAFKDTMLKRGRSKAQRTDPFLTCTSMSAMQISELHRSAVRGGTMVVGTEVAAVAAAGFVLGTTKS